MPFWCLSFYTVAELLHVWLQTGARAQTLQGHGHWVNTLALSAEYALRTGPFDHTGTAPSDPAEAKQVCFAQNAVCTKH